MIRAVRDPDTGRAPARPWGAPVSPIVLDFSDRAPLGRVVSVTRAAADAVAKEGKGTKEVHVPPNVIPNIPDLPDLPPWPTSPTATAPPAPRTSTAPNLSRTTSRHQEELGDDVLAGRAALGDEQAFIVLAERHGPAIYRHLQRMLTDRSAVEDCLQETLLAAWRGLPGFRGEAGVRTWLFTIARRQVFALSRKARPARSPAALDPAEVAERLAAPGGDPAAASLDSALRRAIESALQGLPEQQRSVWLLKEVEGLTYLQIATVLGVSPAAVRGLLARARITLSAALQGWH